MLDLARTGGEARAGATPRASPARGGVEVRLVLGLTLLAAVLRFATLAHQSYWLDESQAAHEMALPFGAMLHAWSTTEWNPPLYLVVAWPWARVFGTGEVGLRSLSALLGVAVVPLLFLAGRELVSARAGVAAAALAAVNPFLIWYSQEAREYMLLGTLCAASLWLFARAWRRPTAAALAWWAAISALALLSQYFAGFLVAAEGLLLVHRARSRASVVALLAMAAVLASLVDHVLPRFQHDAGFIVAVPLSLRFEQVPISFALYPVYQSPIVSDALLAAAAVFAAVIALLIVGGSPRELGGAGIAALLAAVVLLVPLGLALIGHDDYLARGLMPGWLPLAVLLGAACTTERARLGGAGLAVVLLAIFVYGEIRVQADAGFQKPDWRGVARALGRPVGDRAIVAYDGEFATGPLSVYLPRVAWAGPGQRPLPDGPVTISELDVVGDVGDQVGRLPAGVRLIARRDVDGFAVRRFVIPAGLSAVPTALLARATTLLTPAPPGATIVFQSRSA
ncbi:MAG: glycosyltransferase family 39 protein [Solirubrobacterales bacterium]|nr:glycosyltransferase family 39 protein [Solirubrobacterales bacterium]